MRSIIPLQTCPTKDQRKCTEFFSWHLLSRQKLNLVGIVFHCFNIRCLVYIYTPEQNQCDKAWPLFVSVGDKSSEGGPLLFRKNKNKRRHPGTEKIKSEKTMLALFRHMPWSGAETTLILSKQAKVVPSLGQRTIPSKYTPKQKGNLATKIHVHKMCHPRWQSKSPLCAAENELHLFLSRIPEISGSVGLSVSLWSHTKGLKRAYMHSLLDLCEKWYSIESEGWRACRKAGNFLLNGMLQENAVKGEEICFGLKPIWFVPCVQAEFFVPVNKLGMELGAMNSQKVTRVWTSFGVLNQKGSTEWLALIQDFVQGCQRPRIREASVSTALLTGAWFEQNSSQIQGTETWLIHQSCAFHEISKCLLAIVLNFHWSQKFWRVLQDAVQNFQARQRFTNLASFLQMEVWPQFTSHKHPLNCHILLHNTPGCNLHTLTLK